MKKTNSNMTFEERLDQLEQLVQRMEEGGLQLEEMMAVYEQGILLSKSLGQELEKAQAKMQQLKGGALTPMAEEADEP